MASIQGNTNERIFTIDNWLGINQSDIGDTQLKMGEASKAWNWRITKERQLQKRPGTKTVVSLDKNMPIKGLWDGYVNRLHVLLGACDGKLYSFSSTAGEWQSAEIGSINTAGNVHIFGFSNKAYILAQNEYKVWDGATLEEVEGYIPLVRISAVPSGGGEDMENINRLTGKRRMWFSPDGEATVFVLPEKGQHMASIDSVTNLADNSLMTGYTVSTADGTVTFNSPPARGTNSIEIAWTMDVNYRQQVTAMKFSELYNSTQDTRVFLYGDGSNKCIYSEADYDGIPRADYFPDLYEMAVGDANTPITAMIRHYSALICYKKSSTYSVRYGEITLSDGTLTAAFYSQPINRSIGCNAAGQAQIVLNSPRTLYGYDLYEWKNNSSYSSNLTVDERQAKIISGRISAALKQFSIESCICYDDNYEQEYYICYDDKCLVNNYSADAWSYYINDAAMALYELRTKALIESEFRDAIGDGSHNAIRALLASVVNNPEQFALVNKYYGLIPTDVTGAIAFAERVAAGETLAKQASSPEAQKTASAPSELSGEQVVPPSGQSGKQTASERLNPPPEVESVLADMYLEAEERNNASAEAESALQQQENNDIIADSTPETQTTETVTEEAPQAAEESNAIMPAAETQEAAVQTEEAPDVDTPELQGFSERQIEKFKTKPKIKLSKKDYAKVSQARSAKYAGLSSESIPMLEVFPIAEYGQVDVGYRYIVRNTSSDVFEVVGKYKITNKANIMEGTEHDTGRNAEVQRSNQIANQENAAADKGRNRSDSRRAGHGDTDGRIYDVADGSEESAVLEYTDDIAGDSGAYLTSEEETQSAAEAEQPESNVEVQEPESENVSYVDLTEDDYRRLSDEQSSDSIDDSRFTVANVMDKRYRNDGRRRVYLREGDTRKATVDEFFGAQYKETIKKRFTESGNPYDIKFTTELDIVKHPERSEQLRLLTQEITSLFPNNPPKVFYADNTGIYDGRRVFYDPGTNIMVVCIESRLPPRNAARAAALREVIRRDKGILDVFSSVVDRLGGVDFALKKLGSQSEVRASEFGKNLRDPKTFSLNILQALSEEFSGDSDLLFPCSKEIVKGIINEHLRYSKNASASGKIGFSEWFYSKEAGNGTSAFERVLENAHAKISETAEKAKAMADEAKAEVEELIERRRIGGVFGEDSFTRELDYKIPKAEKAASESAEIAELASRVLDYYDKIKTSESDTANRNMQEAFGIEAEEEAVPEAVQQEEAFSDAEIQEREEQRIRDMEREADEARYQEQRHEEKHSIRSSAEYAQQQRKAAAEREAAVKADAAETPAEQDMKSVFGDYAEERLGTFSEKLGNLTARQGTLTSVRNGKRVTGTSRITNGVEVLELAQKCISGEVSVADFKLAYDKLDGTNAGYLYAKEISEAFGALQGDFSSLNNTEHERVSPEKIGKDAIAAFQMLTHRAELAAEYKPTSKKLNAEIKHKKNKTTQTILGKYFGMRSTPDTFWKALGGFDRESGSAAYAMADEALQSNITEKRERSAGYGFFESLKKHKDYQAFAENKLMSGLKAGDLQVELTAQEAVALAHSLRSLREETNNYAYGTPKEICIERNGENVVLFSQTKDKAVDAYVLKSLESEAAKSLTGIAKEYSEALDAMFGYYEPKFTGAIKNVTGFEREKVKPGTYYPLMYDRSGAAKYDIAGALKSKFETLGFAKEREHVGDTLAILPAAKTVDSYIKSVSNYIAWAGFANKLNMLNANIDGTGSLLSVVSEAYSDKTAQMLEQYIEDVSGYSEKPESAFRQLLSRFAGAVITGRPTTAFSQLSSIYAVSGIIKPEAIRRAGIIFPVKQKHVNLDDGLLTDRERHGINDSTIMEVARNADSKIKTIIEKIPGGKTYLNLVGLADAYTTKQIYAAAWCDVELDYPNLRDSNPKLFDSLVESKFAEALLFSQSDADNVNNAYMYRTGNDYMKALTMFTGQPNKQLNMVMTAIGEYNAAKGEAKAKAGQALKEVVRGQVGAAVSYAMMNTIARLLLHKFYSYRDDDDEDKLSMKNTVLTVISDSISTLLGAVWLGDTIGDRLLSRASGGKLGSDFGIQVNGISQINDLRTNITSLIDAGAQGKPVAKISKDLAMSLASLTGVPLQGAYDFANAAALWGRDAYNAIVKGKGIKTDYDIARVLDNDAILTGKVTGKSFYERAVDALTGNGASKERKAAQEAIRELYDETGSNAVFPSQFNGMISDEIILDGKEKEAYGDEMLELFYGNFERIYDTELYKEADTEYKQDIVESLNKYARDSVKRDYFEKAGEEYDSAFEELHDGTVKEESIPEYISYRAVLSSSENNRDYDTIDALIAEFDKLSDDVQGALKDKGGLNVDKLLYAGNFGIDSKDWFETKDIIKEGEETRGTTDEAKAISVYLSMKGKSDEEILEAIKSQITPDRGGKKPAVIRRIEAYNEVAGKRGNIGSWLLLIAQLEDADENGSVSKSDCELAWRNMGLSKKQIYAGISFGDFYNIVKTGSKSYAVNESLVPQYDDFYEALMPEKEKTRYVLSDSFK